MSNCTLDTLEVILLPHKPPLHYRFPMMTKKWPPNVEFFKSPVGGSQGKNCRARNVKIPHVPEKWTISFYQYVRVTGAVTSLSE